MKPYIHWQFNRLGTNLSLATRRTIKMMALRTHTNGYPTVRSNKIDVRFGDASNTDLIKCSGQKGSKGANKGNGPTTNSTSQRHVHLLTHQESASEYLWTQPPSPLTAPFPLTQCRMHDSLITPCAVHPIPGTYPGRTLKLANPVSPEHCQKPEELWC